MQTPGMQWVSSAVWCCLVRCLQSYGQTRWRMLAAAFVTPAMAAGPSGWLVQLYCRDPDLLQPTGLDHPSCSKAQFSPHC